MVFSSGCANYKLVKSSPPDSRAVGWLLDIAEYECYVFQDGDPGLLKDARIQNGKLVGTLIPMNVANLLEDQVSRDARMKQSDRRILDEMHVHLITGMAIPYNIETEVPLASISDVTIFKKRTGEKIAVALIIAAAFVGLITLLIWPGIGFNYPPQ